MQNLPLGTRKIDVFFIVIFSVFTITSLISDLLPTVGVDFTRASSVIYATTIAMITGVVVFGVEFFGSRSSRLRTRSSSWPSICPMY